MAGGEHFAVFVADPGGGVYTAAGSARDGWTPWSNVSEGRAGPGTSVTAVPIAGERFALFVADPGGGVYTAAGSARDGWTPWSSVSQGRAGPGTLVTAVPVAGGERFAVFMADPVGGVYTAWGSSACPIEHFFVLILENRSFDHMLGFSEIAGTDAETRQPTTIDGLTGTESNVFEGRTFTVSRGAPDTMRYGPGHNFLDVLEQLCGAEAVYHPGGPYPPVSNSGYVSSYARKYPDTSSPQDVMRCFTPAQLPVLNALAREFVVCDRWFCSMPGPTEPNRMFASAATSGAFDDSPSDGEIAAAIFAPGGGYKFRQGNVFQLLDKADVKWRIYADDVGYDYRLPFASELDDVTPYFDVEAFTEFAEDLARPSFDARYIHIEPAYDALDDYEDGTSQHPLGSVAAGERFIKAVYETIRSSPVWHKSLLLITYDEHGGFYDHVIPGAAQGTGEKGGTHGFTFEQLGPRVPAVIVSPLIPRNLIDHRPYDHTAITATISRLFGVPSLGQRDGISGGLDHLVGPLARTDAPLKLPDVPASGGAGLPADDTTSGRARKPKAALRDPAALVSEDSHGNVAALLGRAVALHLQLAPAGQHDAIRARARLLTTHADALAYLQEVQQLAHASRLAGDHR
jgi:phospholipase C